MSRPWFSRLPRVLAGLFVLAMATGCEQSLPPPNPNRPQVNPGTIIPGAPISTNGLGSLTVINQVDYYVYPSLDDVSIGGPLIKLGGLDPGESRTYIVPSGWHFLCIYSQETEMDYAAVLYYGMYPDREAVFVFDGELRQL